MRFTTALIAVAAATVASAQQITSVVDSTDFCLFMPQPGQEDMNISDSEHYPPVLFCLHTLCRPLIMFKSPVKLTLPPLASTYLTTVVNMMSQPPAVLLALDISTLSNL
jgi:hypothetical protein